MDANKYKKQLLEEKQKLSKLISEMKDNTVFGDTTDHTSEKYTSGELSSYDNHPADIGTEVYMQDMQNSLTVHEAGKLDNIENALSKIENGNYGICEECQKQIDEERLDILPETNLCSDCAKHQPKKHITSREFNQNLINKGSGFYDEVLLELQEMNKMPNDESGLD
ncbi:TraR/DksA C4-type zinc finger protein [Romboutsia sedimentorum]|uniref:TraR/DksA C4-type zinc finger protein n=1 Tax=Romboutsia sedimentorum TaxID=1368474 RepID=UPI0024DE3C47|nr:TraR/DksA C4-type zinc finger protein [Romboutsia sedimentorum]MDK2586172.1 TraR/DksA C4-type zinc finger protein [Romboutsia sedimentorum]